MQNPGFHFFFRSGKRKKWEVTRLWAEGVVREVTAAGVVVVSTGSGSLRLREKGGLYVFIFAFLFTSIYPISRCVFSHPSIHPPIFTHLCRYISVRLFIYLLTYSLCFFTTCFSSFLFLFYFTL